MPTELMNQQQMFNHEYIYILDKAFTMKLSKAYPLYGMAPLLLCKLAPGLLCKHKFEHSMSLKAL